jgi:hypothetical protein
VEICENAQLCDPVGELELMVFVDTVILTNLWLGVNLEPRIVAVKIFRLRDLLNLFFN